MTKEDCQCNECHGTGETECYHCGSDVECEECQGGGYRDDVIDVAALEAEERKFPSSSWDWVNANGAIIGRTDGTRSIAYSDFAREPIESDPDVPFRPAPGQMSLFP